MAGAERFFDGVSPGDLQIRVPEDNTVWISDRVTGSRVAFTRTSVEVSAPVTASNIVISGQDIETRINEIYLKSGVGDFNVAAVHVAPKSVDTTKVGGVVLGDVGGSGSNEILEGAFIASSGSGGAEGLSNVLLASDGGLNVDGGLFIRGAESNYLIEPHEDNVRFRRDNAPSGVRANLLSSGVPPVIETATRATGIDFSVTDRDGDIRRVMIWYTNGSTPPTQQQITESPSDWYDVEEGGDFTYYVGDATGTAPYHEFFFDRAGTKPISTGTGELTLRRGSSYRFERISSAGVFYVGTSISNDFTDFVIDSSPGTGYSTGLASPGQFVRFTVPDDFSGDLQHYSGADTYKFRILDPVASALASPMHELSGSFSLAGVGGQSPGVQESQCFLAAEDANGNVSAVYGPVSVS